MNYDNDTNTDFLSIELDIRSDFSIRQEALNQLITHATESSKDIREKLSEFVLEGDEFQNQVIFSTEKSIRVLAPAGSGKTQTILNRVINSIRNGVKASRILMLTFDNSAVISIKNKLNTNFDSLQGYDISPEIRTLNSFGYSILRDYFGVEFKGIIPNYRRFRILKDILEKLEEIDKNIFNALPQNISKNYFLEYFSLLKNEIIDPREIDSQYIADLILRRPESTVLFSDHSNETLVLQTIQGLIWLFQAYEKMLNKLNYIDFDDQKLRPYLLLKSHNLILSTIQNKYAEIIVDEFQDINKLDFEFVKLISELSTLVVTGDDDQAIYGFRGCTPEYILNFEKNIGREVKTYKLRKNYRSPKNIVFHSTQLIRHNLWREEKNPIPHHEKLASIKVISTMSSSLEAKYVVEFIKKLKQEKTNLAFDNIAILYRTNAQSLPLQVEMILSGIPYNVREEDNILENKILEKLLGVLRLKNSITNNKIPSPSDSVLSVQAYFQFVNSNQNDQLFNLFTKKKNFLEAISSEEFYSILDKARKSSILKNITKVIYAKTLLDTLDALSLFNGLRGMVGSLEDVIEDKVPLGEIYDIATNFNGDVQEFVFTIEDTLNKARIMNAGKNKDDGVRLLTYFRSKGQQWHTVILTTCNEGIIPHKNAPIEDERRLFYVAMTRAEANLLISFVNNICGTTVSLSRFVKESGLVSDE